MSTETFSLFFALLTVLALMGTAGVLVVRFGVRGPAGDTARHELGRLALPLAWMVATITTAGSLYYSKVVGFLPCELCWYQRIAVYPLVVILGVATFRRDLGVRPYVLGLCILGAPFSAYHTWIQAVPPESGSSFCTDEAPCTVRYVWELGFISLPFMALTAFVTIAALMVAAGRGDRPEPEDAP
jgi:disulfide bond formation protein DsbB